jgi:hypothetical protein
LQKKIGKRWQARSWVFKEAFFAILLIKAVNLNEEKCLHFDTWFRDTPNVNRAKYFHLISQTELVIASDAILFNFFEFNVFETWYNVSFKEEKISWKRTDINKIFFIRILLYRVSKLLEYSFEILEKITTLEFFHKIFFPKNRFLLWHYLWMIP